MTAIDANSKYDKNLFSETLLMLKHSNISLKKSFKKGWLSCEVFEKSKFCQKVWIDLCVVAIYNLFIIFKKGLFLVFGCFQAWLIDSKMFNETKTIDFCHRKWKKLFCVYRELFSYFILACSLYDNWKTDKITFKKFSTLFNI